MTSHPTTRPRRCARAFLAAAALLALATAACSDTIAPDDQGDPAVAAEILPSGDVDQVGDSVVAGEPDVLQVVSESEAASVDAPEGVSVLP